METPLHIAVKSGNVQAVKDLITSGEKIDSRNREGETPLHYAAAENDVLIAEILLKNSATIDAHTIFNRTPLHVAAKFGSVEVLKLLIEKGAKVDEVGKDGSGVLHIAVREKQFEIMKIIIENGANVYATNYLGQNTLDFALEHQHEHTLEIVKILLSKGLTIKKHSVFQALHSMPIMQFLVQNGADINAECPNSYFKPHQDYSKGCKPLHVAALLGKYDMVKYLVESGADVNANNNKDITPLIFLFHETKDNSFRFNGFAETKNRQEIAIYLVEKGAKVNVNESKTMKTPLHYAVKNGYYELVKLLVNKGADVNAIDIYMQTPLLILARFADDSFEAIADILLKNGADINAQENYGYTPLLLGIKNQHEAFVRYILKKGADLSIKTWQKEGRVSKTALQIAELFCYGSLLWFIRQKVKELERVTNVTVKSVGNEISKTQDNAVIENISESDLKGPTSNENEKISFPKIKTNKLACKYCKKIFKRHDLLKTHVRARGCQTQNNSMERNSEIEEIILDDVSIVEEFKIDSIGIALAISKNEFLGPKPAKIQKVDLVEVENAVQILKGFQCHKCPKVCENQESFTNHIISDHSRIDCDVCQKYFVGGSAFRKHFSDAHIATFAL